MSPPANRPAGGDFPPVQLYMELTSACNLSCPHCYLSAGEGPAYRIAPELLHALLEEFRDLGGLHVTFSGGEPTLHTGWRPAFRFARHLGLEPMLLTNGTRLSDEDLWFLQEVSGRVALSLDGADAATHDTVRGAGAFARTLDALGRLATQGMAGGVILCFTPMRGNYRALPEVVALASRLGVGTVYISLLEEERGRAAARSQILPLDGAERTAFLYSVLSLQERYDDVEVQCPNLRFFPERLRGLEMDTDDLDRTIRVTPQADLYLTAYLDDPLFHLGRYTPGRLRAMWYSRTMRQAYRTAAERRSRLPQCRTCRAFFLCRGGSAAFAWAHNRTFQGVDGYCQAKRDLFQEMVEPWTPRSNSM